MWFAGKGEARIRLTPAICQSFPWLSLSVALPLLSQLENWERSQEGDGRSDQEPPNALNLILRSRRQRPNLKEFLQNQQDGSKWKKYWQWLPEMLILPLVGLSICSTLQTPVNQSIQGGLSQAPSSSKRLSSCSVPQQHFSGF